MIIYTVCDLINKIYKSRYRAVFLSKPKLGILEYVLKLEKVESFAGTCFPTLSSPLLIFSEQNLQPARPVLAYSTVYIFCKVY